MLLKPVRRPHKRPLADRRTRPQLTLDVGLVGLSKTRTYGLKANDYNMIFVDPTAAPDAKGHIRAKTMTFDECRAKFAA